MGSATKGTSDKRDTGITIEDVLPIAGVALTGIAGIVGLIVGGKKLNQYFSLAIS